MQTDCKDCALTLFYRLLKERAERTKNIFVTELKGNLNVIESQLCFIDHGLERRDLSKTLGTSQLLAELGCEPRSSWGFLSLQLVLEENNQCPPVFL